MSEARQHWGLACTNGGQFYVCEDDDTQFIGCCVSDPCGRNNGTCPEGDLRSTTFDSDTYANLPSQDCDNSQGVENWYTCAFTSPPFLGCCSQNACTSGCPRNRLEPAKLSKIENNRLDFLHPRDRESTTASTASGTASATTSSTSAAEANGDEGLGTGATAGIAVGASLGGLLALVLILWVFWWRPRQKKKDEQESHAAYVVPGPAPQPPVSEHPYSPSQQGTLPAQSPMSGYQYSFTSTPTVINQHHNGGSPMDRFPKYSPHMPHAERPQSYGHFAEHGRTSSPSLPTYQQAYGQQQVPVISEMDGTTTVRQEMSTGPEHNVQHGQSTASDDQEQGPDIAR
ncbi:hypothetical protein F66182_8012 [Fusarium sp. NRRL 66182]|nr:hypothetical protein F66182_8012 [Fusarium sp. NRRL 66182]